MTGHAKNMDPLVWTCHDCANRRFNISVYCDEGNGQFGPYNSVKLAINNANSLVEILDVKSVQACTLEDGSTYLRYKLKNA